MSVECIFKWQFNGFPGVPDFVSSEGALYVILPYDYPAQQPLFEHTPVLNNNFEHFCHDDFGDYDYYDD